MGAVKIVTKYGKKTVEINLITDLIKSDVKKLMKRSSQIKVKGKRSYPKYFRPLQVTCIERKLVQICSKSCKYQTIDDYV